MAEQFKSTENTVSAPARQMFLITPHATNPIEPLPKAVRFNSAGVVVLRAVDSVADETVDVLAGDLLPVRVQYIRAAGTTVTKIHGLA